LLMVSWGTKLSKISYTDLISCGPKSLVAGASPRTPLGELTSHDAPPNPLVGLSQALRAFGSRASHAQARGMPQFSPPPQFSKPSSAPSPGVVNFCKTATDCNTSFRTHRTPMVVGALRLCKGTSAPGHDEITYSILKRVPDCTLSAIADLYTACLENGYFPKVWKSAIGIMLPKPNKDTKVAVNYRPISLLNTLGKLFEKVITRRMHCHFQETAFFNQYQRAYLERKEASEHVYCLSEEIRLARDKGWQTTVVSLDVEKAFDSVWHDGLRYKLSQLQLPVKLVRLLSSFLTDREIRVRVAHSLSHSVKLGAGTPQGSVLSPLLYLIYVNDIPIEPKNNCRAGQFADDISLWTSYANKRVTYLRLQRALDDIQKWCSKWRIKLNVTKTQLVTFSHTKTKMTLKLFGESIHEQNELTLLGVTFDKKIELY